MDTTDGFVSPLQQRPVQRGCGNEYGCKRRLLHFVGTAQKLVEVTQTRERERERSSKA